MADELKQTIYPASGREEIIIANVGFVTLVNAATPAQLHDGLDSTADVYNHADDHGTGPFADTHVDHAMDAVTYDGEISFLRFVARIRVVVNEGDYAGAGGDSSLRFNEKVGATPFNDQENIFVFVEGPFTTVQADRTTSIHDGGAWDKDEINAHKFGWFLSDDFDFFTSVMNYDSYVSEFRIEVWGPAPPVSLGGYTSYDINRFQDGSPENNVLPEVAAAIARGDQRYMG